MPAFTIDKITNYIPYEDFYQHYLVDNQPCLLSSDFTDSWPCRSDWITSHGKLNFDHLTTLFGYSDVPVTDCGTQTGYGTARCTVEKFRDYLEYLQLDSASRTVCKYLKDWHFQREFPEQEQYTVPEYFTSDWLNEYCDSIVDDAAADDYRFLYLGPAGSWTPFHEDVLQSFSWSANVCGRKKWLLFPPDEEDKLRVNGQFPADVTAMDLSTVRHAEVIQEAGEILFVPSRWHHQVHNLEDTLSINHNWINAANAANMWKLLGNLLQQVEAEIADCRADFTDDTEWRTQCQRILKADVAMDFSDFKRMISVVLDHRKILPPVTHELEWLTKRDIDCASGLLAQIEKCRFFRRDASWSSTEYTVHV